MYSAINYPQQIRCPEQRCPHSIEFKQDEPLEIYQEGERELQYTALTQSGTEHSASCCSRSQC